MAPSKGLPSRAVFQLKSVKSLQINNSRFLNLQNTSILTYNGNYDNEIASDPGDVSLTFNNITVTNNTVNIQDDAADQANLFSFHDDSSQTNQISFC